ncbi:MAG TPA: AzlC family ABC transporter permease [Pseudolabrys sp.]|nr:AzlC family ABC transporter permease [Pseudolabrys sp.]
MAAQSDIAVPATSAFFAGVKSAVTSVFFLVLMGTYIGIGALAHDFGFSSWWLALSSLLVWAAPAQVILISSLGGGAAPIEVAIAVTLSAIRLFPMVVALLPLLRDKAVPTRRLLLPMHFTAVSMWVESLRILPSLPRARRIAFCNGLGAGYMGTAVAFGFAGYYLAAGLPPLLAGALLFLTPMSFLMSTARNSRQVIDRLAFVLGLVIGPLLTAANVRLDLMWTGIAGGTIAYGIYRLREALR